MPYYTLNRDYTLASTMGLSVEFTKDTSTYVPPLLVPEIEALGGEESAAPDGDGSDLNATAGREHTGSAAPTDPAERELAIKEAIEDVTLRNNRDDFNAGGKPNIKPLADYLGWTPTAAERDSVLAKIANGSL